MISSLSKKSLGDLKKRKSRTIFTILTIALGVAALGMFGVVPMFNEAMEADITSSNMWNVRANMVETQLSSKDIESIEGIDNVENAEFKQIFFTKIYIGERRNDALFVGINDLENAKVDKVEKRSGEFPEFGEVLTGDGNSRYDLFMAGSGEQVSVMDHKGRDVTLIISGSGRTLTYDHSNWGIAVFFTNIDTLSILSNSTGYNSMSIDMKDTDPENMDKSIDDIKDYLEGNTDFVAFTDIPETREDGHWPGEGHFANMANFFYVLTFMTLFCSVFLISNTMHTIITEQKKEISQMKAIGATKRKIVRSYLTTSLIMGSIGSIIGVFLGVWITFGMVWFLATSFYGLVPSFSVSLPTMIISALVGIMITILATLPALVSALRTNTREGLQETGINANYGSSRIDKVLIRSRWMPRSIQMGFRNVARKKGRSISTMLQVALAVAMFLGVVSVGHSLTLAVSEEFDNFQFDIRMNGQAEGGKPLTYEVEVILDNIDGVQNAEPFIQTVGKLEGKEIYILGFSSDTTSYDVAGTMLKGRWFTQQEQNANDNVIILDRSISKITGKGYGDTITLETATGPHSFEVIGINSGQSQIGFVPMDTLSSVLMWNGTVSGFMISTSSTDQKVIDKTSTEIEDTLVSMGYVVENEIWYVMEENNIRSNQNIINLMIAVGSLIVFITTIGLMSTLTMNVL